MESEIKIELQGLISLVFSSSDFCQVRARAVRGEFRFTKKPEEDQKFKFQPQIVAGKSEIAERY
jgi:hypothetical protein